MHSCHRVVVVYERMFGAVGEAKSKLAEAVASLDAACLSAGDAAALFADLVECERLAAAGLAAGAGQLPVRLRSEVA